MAEGMVRKKNGSGVLGRSGAMSGGEASPSTEYAYATGQLLRDLGISCPRIRAQPG